jgi:uncharacterized membrane protein
MDINDFSYSICMCFFFFFFILSAIIFNQENILDLVYCSLCSLVMLILSFFMCIDNNQKEILDNQEEIIKQIKKLKGGKK